MRLTNFKLRRQIKGNSINYGDFWGSSTAQISDTDEAQSSLRCVLQNWLKFVISVGDSHCHS
jgi:hypothetical protein